MDSFFDEIDHTVTSRCAILLWAMCILLHVAAGIVAVTVAANGANILIFEEGFMETLTGAWMFTFGVVPLTVYLVKSLRVQIGITWTIFGIAIGTPVGIWMFLSFFLVQKEISMLGVSTPGNLFLLAATVMLVGLFVPLKSKPGS